MRTSTPAKVQICAGAATLLQVLLGFVALGLWGVTGNTSWLRPVFEIAGSFFLLSMALLEAVTSRAVWRQFEPHEELFGAWRFLMGAAAFRVVAVISGQIFPVTLQRPESAEHRVQLQVFGVELLGAFATIYLGVGLWRVFRAQRRLGLHWRLRNTEHLLILLMLAWAALQLFEFRNWVRDGGDVSPLTVLKWLVDPFLVCVFLLGILVWSASRPLQPGLIGRTWWFYTLASAITTLGNIGTYVLHRGMVEMPWGGVFWLLWYVQAAMFAMAPLYQYRAMTEWGEAPDAAEVKAEARLTKRPA